MTLQKQNLVFNGHSVCVFFFLLLAGFVNMRSFNLSCQTCESQCASARAEHDWSRKRNTAEPSCYWHFNPHSCFIWVTAASFYPVGSVTLLRMTFTSAFENNSLSCLLFATASRAADIDWARERPGSQAELCGLRPGARVLPAGPAGSCHLSCAKEEGLPVHHWAPGWGWGSQMPRGGQGCRAGRR